MKTYKTIEIEILDKVATLWLNRPEVHNAFNETMISEISRAINEINEISEIRVIVVRGRGRSFCAGADLNWMKDVATYSYRENFEESFKLASCFHTIYKSSKPTIAAVHGAAFGGANGILASCDFAFCEEHTVFSFSEVKIGIVPATISPYVIKRIGEFPARELMLTGKRFSGLEAESFGLVNMSLKSSKIEDHLQSVIEQLFTSGPEALKHCKRLIYDVSNKADVENLLEYTADLIAKIRSSGEGQEGMEAFLKKRKPNWDK